MYLWNQEKADNSSKTLPAPTTDTTGWETYKNDRHGLSFQYPSNLKYSEETRSGVYSVVFWSDGHQYKLKFDIDSSKTFSQTVKEFVQGLNDLWKNEPSFTIFNTRNVSIDQQSAIEQEIISKVLGKSIYTYFIKNNFVWSFAIIPDFNNKVGLTQNQIDMYHQILSTFRFTK